MELVFLKNEQATTTSLIVAEAFDKRHDNVIQAIKNLDCPEEFSLLNFKESKYTLRGKEYPMYYITHEGFFFLAMGFSGTRATKFKIEFIAQFKRLAELAIKRNTGSAPLLLPTYQRRMKALPAKKCPKSRWNVFNMIGQLMIEIENEVGSISEYDLVDGSVGQHWCKYRQGKPWAKTVTQFWYKFDDKRGEQLANCYDYNEAEHFNVWLEDVYRKVHLPEYLKNKFKKDKDMYPRVLAFLPKLLPGKSA